MKHPDLTPRLLQDLTDRLASERKRLLASVHSLQDAVRSLSESQGEESDAGGAPADVASDLAEQAVDSALERIESDHLAEVEAALDRLARGRYGICEDCGEPINVERLYALPWARYCVTCAARQSNGSSARHRMRASEREPELLA